MKEVIINKDYGSFRLDKKIRLWLLREREAFHLFGAKPLEESSFSKSVVLNKIKDKDVDFSRRFDERWGYFNWFIVDIQNECFCLLKTDIRIGVNRSEPELIKAVRKFEPDNLEIVEVEENLNYQIKQTGKGEKIIEHRERSGYEFK